MKDPTTTHSERISPPAVLAFGGFRLDCQMRRLKAADGSAIPISARAFDTLRYLASHPHELLSRQRMMREIWPNTVVEQNNLDQQISVLRKVLGEGEERRFIITVTGQGFRFVQDVEQVPPQPALPNTARPPAESRWPMRPSHRGVLALIAMLALAAGGWFAATNPTHLRANADYLQARDLIRKSGSTQVRTAIDLLEKAVRHDPDFAPAWAALAEGYTYAADFPSASALKLSPVELQQRVAGAALKAFELAPNAPETLRSAGMVSMQNHDWAEAEARLRRALDLAGADDYEANLQYAWFLMNVGRASEAVQYEERAMRAESSLMRPVALRAALYEMEGDLDAAQSLLLTSTQLRENDPLRRQGLIMVRMARHDRCGEPAVSAEDGLPCPLLADPERTLSEARSYYEEAAAGGGTGQLFALANFAAFLGDTRLAFDMLDLWSRGTTQNLHVMWRPVMRDVRATPGFANLVTRLGLVDYWRTTGNWGDFCRPTDSDSFTCGDTALAEGRPL